MLVLVNPSFFEAREIEEFRQEFIRKGEKIYGGEGLRRCKDAAQWLIDRPWKRWPSNTLFFSYDTQRNRCIGCVRITFQYGSQAVLHHGFNIGQSIRPSERGRGYGKQQLKLALSLMKDYGDNPVLCAADCDNIASCKTIEACGGECIAEQRDVRIYKILI